jgi:DNA-binding transcriptional ArsR family regulator
MQLSAIWYISRTVAKAKIKSEIDWNDLAESLKSTAHPERLAILHLMCNCGCDQIMVKDIYCSLHLEQSITSRHLGIMKKSGVLKREIKEGRTFYRFNKDNLTAQCIKKLLME